MVNMVVGEAGHGVIAVIVVGLIPDVDTILLTNRLCSFGEILRKKLFLLIKVVAGALHGR